LKQIPHFESQLSFLFGPIWGSMLTDILQVINRGNDARIETVYDVLEMEDDDCTKLLDVRWQYH